MEISCDCLCAPFNVIYYVTGKINLLVLWNTYRDESGESDDDVTAVVSLMLLGCAVRVGASQKPQRLHSSWVRSYLGLRQWHRHGVYSILFPDFGEHHKKFRYIRVLSV